MKRKSALFITAILMLVLIMGLLVACGEAGPQGPQGEPGKDGTTPVITIGENGNWLVDGVETGVKAQGADGQTGAQGADGTTVLTGNGAPSGTLGKNGDSYIDFDNFDFYVKTDDVWTKQGNIKGESGVGGATSDHDGTPGLEFYPINDTECAVSAGTARLFEEIVIPSTWKGYTVTAIIGEVANEGGGFENCDNLRKITIPSSITRIGDYAFYGCKRLLDVFYDGTVEQIYSVAIGSGNSAFTKATIHCCDGEIVLILPTYFKYLERFKNEIESGMASDATDEEKALAAWILYRIASMADYNAPEKAKYTTGGGRATGDLLIGDNIIDIAGEMNMAATYYTILDAQGNKYVAKEEYTQVPEGTVEASSNGKPNNMLISVGEAALPAFLGFARRGIVTPDKTVTWAGANESSVITETGVTGKFANKEKQFNVLTAEEAAEKASAYERDYGANWGDAYGGTAPDLSIHVINLDTIIPDSVVITKELFSDYYTVSFEVDVNAIVGQGVDAEGNTFDIHATWYAEQLYLANAGLDFLNSLSDYSLRYSKLKVNMTVFDNGYIRTWSTDEIWIMSANITHDAVVSLFGSASSSLTAKVTSDEVYYYDHDTIMQGFVNRWIGDNRYVGMPMSELPFAEKLAGYEKQEYGSYQ